MRRIWLIAVVIFSSSASPNQASQNSANDDGPIFRTGTRLVQVDVIVRGKDAPIEGLTKDDFEVSDNGKKQPISIFSVRRVDRSGSKAPLLPPGVVTNRPIQAGSEPVSVTILLFDFLNSDWNDQTYARKQLQKFLENADTNEHVAVYVLNQTLTVILPFTDDRAAIHRAVNGTNAEVSATNQEILEGASGNAAPAAGFSSFQRRTDIVSAGLQALARHLKGVPGRKKVIWMTAGLPMTIVQETVRNGTQMREYSNFSEPLIAAARALTDANVALYTIDPRGVIGAFDCPPASPIGCGLADPNLTTALTLTRMTGGKAFYGDNGISFLVRDAVHDTDLTYTLGFYQSEDAINGDYHSINVKVLRNRPESKEITDDIKEVRYRRGYNAELPRRPLTGQQRKGTLNFWVNETYDATELGLQAAAAPAVEKAGYYDVEVCLDVAGLQLEQKNGRWVGAFEIAIAPDISKRPKGLHQVIQINLTPEKYVAAMSTGITVVNQVRVTDEKGKLLSRKLHLVVMDAVSGKAGSVRIPISE